MKTIGIIYSQRATYTPSLKFKKLLLLEIMFSRDFQTLTSGDLKWPLTSMKNNRDHLLTKFESSNVFTAWDTMFTRFSDFDLWPPWKQLWIIYSQRATYTPSLKFRQLSLNWDIVFTSQGVTHTHTPSTHTRHTPSPSHRFLTGPVLKFPSGIFYIENSQNFRKEVHQCEGVIKDVKVCLYQTHHQTSDQIYQVVWLGHLVVHVS